MRIYCEKKYVKEVFIILFRLNVKELFKINCKNRSTEQTFLVHIHKAIINTHSPFVGRRKTYSKCTLL